MVEELRKVRDEQVEQRRLFGEEYQDYDLIFCQPNGKPLHAHNIAQRDFRRVQSFQSSRKELGARGVSEELLPKPLPRIRFHDLRHCHATLLLQQGVHPKVVQERLGHSTVGMTLDTYSHVLPGMQEEATQLLQRKLFN
jgi:integrase